MKKKPVQIYIDPKQDRALGVLAKTKGISKAEIIRLGIDKYLGSLPVDDDPAMGIIGLGKSGKVDIAERHDAYIAEHAGKKKLPR